MYWSREHWGITDEKIAQQAFFPVPWLLTQVEDIIQRFDMRRDLVHDVMGMPVPDAAGIDRLAHADIHVGVPEDDVALDQQFLGLAHAQPPGKQIDAFEQQIFRGTDRVKGDVGRDDQGRLQRRRQQFIEAVEFQQFPPALQAQPVVFPESKPDGDFQRFHALAQDRWTGMVLAPVACDAGIDAVLAAFVDDAAVLDHAAFREDDDLAAAQQLPGQQGEQAWMVVWIDADPLQIAGQDVFFAEEFAGCDGAAVGAGLFEDQKLRNEGFEAGKMIEQEDVALQHLRVGMQFDVDAEHVLHRAEQLHRALVSRGIDIGPVFRVCGLLHGGLFQR